MNFAGQVYLYGGQNLSFKCLAKSQPDFHVGSNFPVSFCRRPLGVEKEVASGSRPGEGAGVRCTPALGAVSSARAWLRRPPVCSGTVITSPASITSLAWKSFYCVLVK